MREIKFRAWDKVSKVMIDRYEYLISLNGFLTALLESCNKDGGYDDILNDSLSDVLVLMQYTGLKDKNGKEVYDGDIMIRQAGKWIDGDTDSYYEVKFGKTGDKRYGYYLEANNGDTTPFYEDFERFEVAGNIYENKELLND